MEDPDAEETKAFVDAENAVSRPYLDGCSVKSKIQEDLTKLKNYEKFSIPSRRGDRYYFYRNTGLQNQR